MRSLYLLNVTAHVLFAILWLGGLFFLGLVGAPVLRRVEPPELRARLFRSLGERFRVVAWIAIPVLLTTGILNLWFRGALGAAVSGDARFWSSPFGEALAWKLGLVIAMIAVSALHDFVEGPRASRFGAGSAEALRSRRRAVWLARLNAILAVLLVSVAVHLPR